MDQKGAANLIVTLLVVAGIAGGVFLVTNNSLNLFSKATNPTIVFKSASGAPLPTNPNGGIPTSSSYSVKIELTSPFGLPVFPTPAPSLSCSSVTVEGASMSDSTYTLISGTNYKMTANVNNSSAKAAWTIPGYTLGYPDSVGKFDYSLDPTNYLTVTYTPQNTTISDQGYYIDVIVSDDKGSTHCPAVKIVSKPKSALEQDVPEGVGTTAPVLGVNEVVSTTPISGTASYRIAENPNALNSATYQPYTKEPTIIDYTFQSNPNQKRFIWVEFLSADGKKDIRSAQIIIKPSPTQAAVTPAPTCQPRPACLDAEPRCLRNEPIDGWCPVNFGKALSISESGGNSFMKVPAFTYPKDPIRGGRYIYLNLWVKPTPAAIFGTSPSTLIDKGFGVSGGPSGYQLNIVNKKIEFRIADKLTPTSPPSYRYLTSTTVLEPYRWYYIFIYAAENNTVTLGVNNTIEVQDLLNIMNDSTSSQITLGCARQFDGSTCFSQFTGEVDEFLIGVGQMNRIPPSVPIIPDSRTIALYHLDGNTDDASENNLDAEVSGSFIDYIDSTVPFSP